MSSILTNSKVGANMSDLELRARRGDPWAQAELTKQCKQFSVEMLADSKLGADMQERNKLINK